MRGRVLIIDEMHKSLLPGLKRLGFEPDYLPEISRQNILDRIGHYTGIIVRSKTDMDPELLGLAHELKFIARAGAGTDNIDVDFCNQKNIIVLNSPEGNKDALAEHAVGMILTLFNKIHIADRQVKNFQWDREGNRGREIFGKTIGIVGYGNMGGAFARRLSGFSCNVLAYDKYKTGYEDIYARESSMNDLFRECDIVSLHVPLTPETKSFYNFSFFSQFRKNIYLINTARGKIVPLADLLKLLETGKISGAALDVLEFENPDKLNDEQKRLLTRLAKNVNVLLTPHVGGWSYESHIRINEVLLEKISRLSII